MRSVLRATAVVDCAVISVTALLLMAYWLLSGSPDGHSYHHNAVWIRTFSDQFATGDLYPRWIGALWSEAGGADFFFYAPLPFWLAATLRVSLCPGCSVDQLLNLSGTLLLAVSGIGFRALAMRFTGRFAALVAAMIYMALPYHLAANWGDRQAFGEFAAMAFVPWHFSAALGCIRLERGGYLKLALWTALILLSHLPTSLILMVGYIGLAVACWPRFTRAVLLRLAFAALIGLGISAVYWYPAISLLDSINTQGLSREHIRWENNILTFEAISEGQHRLYFGLWLMFVSMSSLIIALIVMTSEWRSAPVQFSLILLGVVWFMVTPLSSPVWEHSAIKAVQFPWRFLLLADVAFALASARLVECFVARNTATRTRTLTGALALGIMIMPLADSVSVPPQGPDAPSKDLAMELAAGAMEWLPAELENARAFDLQRQMHAVAVPLLTTAPIVSDDGALLRLQGLSNRRAIIEGRLDRPATVTIKRTYWRYWQLTDLSTGTSVAIRPTAGFPLIQADLPAGPAKYQLDLPRLPEERIGFWISLIASLFFAIALAIAWIVNPRWTGSAP